MSMPMEKTKMKKCHIKFGFTLVIHPHLCSCRGLYVQHGAETLFSSVCCNPYTATLFAGLTPQMPNTLLHILFSNTQLTSETVAFDNSLVMLLFLLYDGAIFLPSY